jgi:hypothetical protein
MIGHGGGAAARPPASPGRTEKSPRKRLAGAQSCHPHLQLQQDQTPLSVLASNNGGDLDDSNPATSPATSSQGIEDLAAMSSSQGSVQASSSSRELGNGHREQYEDWAARSLSPDALRVIGRTGVEHVDADDASMLDSRSAHDTSFVSLAVAAPNRVTPTDAPAALARVRGAFTEAATREMKVVESLRALAAHVAAEHKKAQFALGFGMDSSSGGKRRREVDVGRRLIAETEQFLETHVFVRRGGKSESARMCDRGRGLGLGFARLAVSARSDLTAAVVYKAELPHAARRAELLRVHEASLCQAYVAAAARSGWASGAASNDSVLASSRAADSALAEQLTEARAALEALTAVGGGCVPVNPVLPTTPTTRPPSEIRHVRVEVLSIWVKRLQHPARNDPLDTSDPTDMEYQTQRANQYYPDEDSRMRYAIQRKLHPRSAISASASSARASAPFARSIVQNQPSVTVGGSTASLVSATGAAALAAAFAAAGCKAPSTHEEWAAETLSVASLSALRASNRHATARVIGPSEGWEGTASTSSLVSAAGATGLAVAYVAAGCDALATHEEWAAATLSDASLAALRASNRHAAACVIGRFVRRWYEKRNHFATILTTSARGLRARQYAEVHRRACNAAALKLQTIFRARQGRSQFRGLLAQALKQHLGKLESLDDDKILGSPDRVLQVGCFSRPLTEPHAIFDVSV